ncbi:RHS repeat domain-containing protein [Agromyces silvae]|uniref:RHS repeat domain-containing protein n=1 Tax=Agromyces silvae TaxID=3388266 RepID=UPI00280ACCD4|nr:RHS repeat-associated core domain-containing protein [Agromyces protaetiae]
MAVVRDGSVHTWRGAALGGALCAALLLGGVSPSWAADEGSGAGGGSPVLGALPLGAGVQGTLDERAGSFSFEVPLGGLSLAWDSRGRDEGRFGFGPRWSVGGVAYVDTQGGVRVIPSRGVQGVFEADATAPSGLASYIGDDVRFAQTPGVLPPRADGVLGEREYAFVLRELGGMVSYFDAAGDPVAKLDAHGNRVDWRWGPGHRLKGVVTEHGVVTELDWSDPARVEVRSRAGAGDARPVGTVELDGGQVAEVTDASGARTTVTYAPSGLVEQVGTASGAVTRLTWQQLPDGTSAVQRVAVTDPATGEVIVERHWEAVAALASGWPAATDAATQATSGVEFRTAVTDGVNRVTTTYDGAQAMTRRDTSESSPSGERVLQRQHFAYPDRDAGAPGRVDRPSGIDLTLFNVTGTAKTVSEGFVFDAYGRVAEHTAADGTVTRTEYDAEVPADLPEDQRVPIGLPVLERTAAPDGSVTETRYTLNEARTAVTVAETYAGRRTDAQLTRTGRTEFVVDPDGFVSTERVYPQGGEGKPLVTEHTESIDLAAGTRTTTETVAAHTDLAGITTTVTDLIHGRQLAATDVLGRTATATYDPAGRPITTTISPIDDDPGATTDRLVASRSFDERGASIEKTLTAAGESRTGGRWVYDLLGREQTVTDQAGGVTLAADGTRSGYNALNQPVRETTPTGATTRTGYWATGDRATLTTREQTTGFYWDDGTLLNDTHTTADTTQTASYLTGLTRESRTLTDDTVYAIHDRHGNTTELTDPTGTPTARYAYTDYGTTTTTTTATTHTPDEASRYPFLYAGEYTNPSGTQHLAVRTYTPDRFAFTTLDTLPLQNRYGYANANPITNIDPTGHFSVADVINGVVIAAGVLFTVVTAWATFGATLAALSPAAAIAVAASAGASVTVSSLAGVAGSTLAVLGYVNDNHVQFLDEGTRERFTYSEYALMGVGVLATGLTVAALKVAPKMGAATAQQTEPVIQLVTENTTPLDKALKTFKPRAYLSQRTSATDFGRRTEVYEVFQRTATQEVSTALDWELNVSGIGLASVSKDYELAVTRLNTTSLAGEQLLDFLKEHRTLIEYAEKTFAKVRGAVLPAFKGTDDERAAFNLIMPALEETPEFAAIALLLGT